ncbi:hypothetical protein Sjap_022703 [Stephania japonica]|uniref:Uncharacterized protein n=1 Tax=Stephania japonica TaxID=461633 RepID=A0AAP0EPD7_9MAGN
MDLGCLDLGCISVLEKHSKGSKDDETAAKDADADESATATSKTGKNKAAKETTQSMLNAVNRSTTQIKKPHRKNSSPLNWFPRKKTDSYLKRKIRLLQEVGGMNSSLVETLGDSNPHYSRVLREKIAAREAAQKAMEARKAAMVEASWCRILRAARIQCKEAEALLVKAEKSVAEAFEEAATMGVIMYDRPNCPRKPCEVESSSVNKGGSTTHTVKASFETAFEVDKEVAAAVKNAFIRLANFPSPSKKDEFKNLLWRISQNPDVSEPDQKLLECSSECQSHSLPEMELVSHGEAKEGKFGNGKPPDVKPSKLIDMMLERLKRLQEDELSSLATIVATSGLNAVLLEVENSKPHDLSSGIAYPYHPPSSSSSLFSTGRSSNSNVPEVPSLDKFLVKHVSRLEREVQEAKNKRKNEIMEELKNSESNTDALSGSAETVPDLASVLVKQASKEIEEVEKDSEKSFQKKRKQLAGMQDVPDLPSLDKILLKHVTKLEREVEEAKNARMNMHDESSYKNQTRGMGRLDNNSCSTAVPDLGSILIKHSSKLQKEIEEQKKLRNDIDQEANNQLRNNAANSSKGEIEAPSLDKVLVKHMSRLEREVQEAKTAKKNELLGGSRSGDSSCIVASSVEDIANLDSADCVSTIGVKQVAGKENINSNSQAIDMLGKTLKESSMMEHEEMEKTNMGLPPSNAKMCSVRSPSMKSMSRIERAKLEALQSFSVQEAKEESDCGLDRILIKKVHRLERDKTQALMEEGNGIHNVKRQGEADASNCESLDKVLVKHQSRLEKEKLLMTHQSEDDQMKRSTTARQKAREKELEEAWGGLSLGNSIRPHVSRLERDKAKRRQAAKERKMRIG